MKIIRSSKHSTKFISAKKQAQLAELFAEFKKVTDLFIDIFWNAVPQNRNQINKPVIDLVLEQTWLSYRARKAAAYEAFSLVSSEKNKEKSEYSKPQANENKIMSYGVIADFVPAKRSKEFDAWIHIHSVGNKIKLDLPIKLHRHYRKLAAKGRLMNSVIISKNYIQLCFEIEIGAKSPPKKIMAVDTGMRTLAVSNNGDFFGRRLNERMTKVLRKEHGSKNQKSARRSVRHYIDETVKEIIGTGADLIVLENLKNITKGRKKKGKHFNKLLNSWEVSYFHNRLKQKCEENRVAWRTVGATGTSITCSNCENKDKKNRNGEEFLCRACGHAEHADVNAAKNILKKVFQGKFPIPKV